MFIMRVPTLSLRAKSMRTKSDVQPSLRVGFCDRFRRDCGGNTILMFGLSLFAIILAIGCAIDMTRVMTARKNMQDAADAALLAIMIKSASTTQDQRVTWAASAFDKNFHNPSVYGVNKVLTNTATGTTISQSYAVTANVTSYFGGFIGIDHYNVKVLAKAESQMQTSEIALVLDSTGSMADSNKMTNLKSSVDSVLASLLNSSGVNVSNTKVAIVPFNTQVKIAQGTALTYVDYGAESMSEGCKNISGTICTAAWDVYDKICNGLTDQTACRASVKGWSNVTSPAADGSYFTTVTFKANVNGNTVTFTDIYKTKTTTTAAYSYTDETGVHNVAAGTSTSTGFFSASTSTASGSGGLGVAPTTTDPNGYKSIAGGSLVYNVSNSGGYGSVAAKTTVSTVNGTSRTYLYPAYNDTKTAWTGCVIDRTKPYDTQVTAPTASIAATLYPARTCATSTLKPVQALSTNIATARSFVQTLTPGGNTNITIGVQWGMEVLSPTDPFVGGVNFNDPLTHKYMIIVTDGENTANRDYTSSNPANAVNIDPRTALACTNAKAQGITVFVVKVIEGNSDMLRACASRSDYFYDLSSASQLNTALSAVFEAIKKTRLTQ